MVRRPPRPGPHMAPLAQTSPSWPRAVRPEHCSFSLRTSGKHVGAGRTGVRARCRRCSGAGRAGRLHAGNRDDPPFGRDPVGRAGICRLAGRFPGGGGFSRGGRTEPAERRLPGGATGRVGFTVPGIGPANSGQTSSAAIPGGVPFGSPGRGSTLGDEGPGWPRWQHRWAAQFEQRRARPLPRPSRRTPEYTWAAAAVGSNEAAGYQLASGEPVMAIGGFNGTDPAPPSLSSRSMSAKEKSIISSLRVAAGGVRPGAVPATTPPSSRRGWKAISQPRLSAVSRSTT